MRNSKAELVIMTTLALALAPVAALLATTCDAISKVSTLVSKGFNGVPHHKIILIAVC